MLRRVLPQVPPRVGGRCGERLAQLWRPGWPTLGAASPPPGHFWPILAPMLPHLESIESMLAHLKHTLSNLGPRFAQKKTKRKKPWKKPMDSQGFGTHVDAMLDQL